METNPTPTESVLKQETWKHHLAHSIIGVILITIAQLVSEHHPDIFAPLFWHDVTEGIKGLGCAPIIKAICTTLKLKWI